MKIPDIRGLFSIARGALDPHKGQPGAARPGGPQADKVELSSQGQVVRSIAAQRSDDRARAALIAKLRASYEKGELKADSQATAKAMVEDGILNDLIEK